MGYFREGIEYTDTFTWGSGVFYLCFGNGVWSPTTSEPFDVFLSEVGDRISVNPVITWNSLTRRNEIVIDEVVNLTSALTFNRVFIVKDGDSQGRWDTSLSNDPALIAVVPGNNFQIGETFYLEDTGDLLTVLGVSGSDVSFSGQSRDFLSSDVLLDSRGILLAGITIENTIYPAFTDNFINLKFESIVT